MKVFDNYDGTVTITLNHKQANRLLDCLDVLDHTAHTKANRFAAKLTGRFWHAGKNFEGGAGEHSGSVVLED